MSALDFSAALRSWIPWVQMGFRERLRVEIFVIKSSVEDLSRIFSSL